MKRLILTVLFIGILLAPDLVTAHGTGFKVINNAPAVVAEFYYTDNTPMAYAAVLVFSPENKEIEYQNGRTDQEGRFSFYPKTQGKWWIKVNDGMGHAVKALVDVGDPGMAIGSPGADTALASPGSMAIKIGLGISLLLNIFMGLGALRKKCAPEINIL